MAEQHTVGGLDFEALRRAIEQSDAESLASFYAEDAELLIVKRNATPSSPEVLRGKEAIAEALRDVCGRDMTRIVRLAKQGGRKAAADDELRCHKSGRGF
jgi:hypothetical protein